LSHNNKWDNNNDVNANRAQLLITTTTTTMMMTDDDNNADGIRDERDQKLVAMMKGERCNEY
jgi:hypothetical protein